MTFIHAPLLQPLRIGAMTIQNRFCAGPLTLPSLQGPFGEFSPDGLAYFEARAKGGFGLLFTGAFHPDTLVDPVHPLDSKQPLKAPKTFQRSAVELLERLDAYGTKMLPQVSMGYGRNALGCFCPSEIPYYHDPARKAPALTREQIQQKIDQMIATAVLLRQCGFPGIEVHAMHWGYLLDQFALSFMNHRTDEYGGALENRLRCAREIVEGVKAACGADFVVSMRLALKSYIKGYNKPSLHGEEEVGRTLEEGLEIARRLEAYGYDCLSVDFGQYDSFYYAAPPCYMEKGRVIPLAAAVKQVVKIPILCGGRMNDPDLAAQAIAQGKLDAVVLGRPSLADPAYPQKVATGRPEDIRPCIGCNQGCIGALKVGRRAGCAVNPQAAREASFALTPAPRKKSVLVVGGGVAGMEAARCAALRGHDVTLCEGSDRLGGNLIPAGAHPFKEELNELLVELRLRIPDEIKQYQKIISNQEAILSDAHTRADALLAEATAQTNELVNEHEIMQKAYAHANEVIEQAQAQAQAIIDSAVNDANNIRQGSIQYTDDMLKSLQNIINHSMEGAQGRFDAFMSSMRSSYDIVSSNRKELSGGIITEKEEEPSVPEA